MAFSRHGNLHKYADTRLQDLICADLFPWLKSDGSAGWDSNFLARTWVPTDAALARFDDEDTKSSQFNPFAAFKGILQRIEYSFHRNLRLHLGNVQMFGNTVHDVLFDHADPP